MNILRKKMNDTLIWKGIFCFAFWGNVIGSLWLISIFQKLVDAVIASNKTVMKDSIILFMIVLAVDIIFIVLDQYGFRSITNYGEMNLKKYTVNHYLLNVASKEKGKVGRIVSNINSDVPIISKWLSVGRVNTCSQIVYLFLCIMLMFYYSAQITGIILGLITVVFAASRYFSIRESKYKKHLQTSFETISNKIYNSFLNLKTIRQLDKQDYFTQKVKQVSLDDTEKQIEGLGRCMAINETLLSFMADTLPLFVFFLGILMNSVGTGFSLMLIAQKLNEPIIVLAELIADKKNAEQVYERIKGLYKEEASKNGAIADPLKPFEQFEIRIHNFSYENSTDVVLKDVDLNITRGDLCVIQGESGRGKTTLLKIISKFLELKNEQGVIKYNGQNIQELDVENYFSHVLMVEQNSIIIEGSLEENILLGDTFSKEEISQAIYISKLDDFMQQRGKDYKIKENGKNISGGEKQRINLARMILRNPEVLILDEVTSSLDREIREAVVSRLLEYKERKQITIIAISHHNDYDRYSPKKYMLE